MNKTSILLTALVLINVLTFGQLTGIKTIPGTYPSLALAIADLNTQGVGPGGVTFDIAAGYVETFTSSTDGLISVTNSLPSKPIRFQKSGAGSNPKILAAYGEGYYDYILCIAGTDYLTIDGLDLFDSPDNTDIFTQAEYGVVFAKADADTSGTQFCTVKNCTISLTRSNTGTVGIIMRNWKGSAVGVTLSSINSTRKANSHNSIQGNYITNCFTGIYLYGSASLAPYETYDQSNDIGSVSGNTITNFGGASGSCYGLFAQNENGMIVANNRITGNVPGGFCIGMEFQSTASASLDVYGNYISIQYDGTGYFYGIRDYFGNTATNSNVVNIHDNIITRCTAPNATLTVSYMEIGHGGPTFNCYNNWIVSNEYGSNSKPSKSEVHHLYVGFLPSTFGVANIYNNRVSSNVRYQSLPSTGGTTSYMRFGPQCQTVNCYENVCDSNTSTTNGQLIGIECPLASPVNKYIHNNSFLNQYGANGPTYCIYVNDGNSWDFYNNKVLNVEGTGPNSVITGMYLGYVSGNGNIFIYNNIVGNLKSSTASSTNAVTGMWVYGGLTVSQVGIFNNTIFLNASSVGANFGTTGMTLSKSIKNADLRNNIIVNISTPNGTGKTVALVTDSIGFGNLAKTSNNNNYYCGTPSAQRIIFSDGVTDNQTLLSYRTRFYPREYSSITENPPFVSVTNPVDLHINPSVATQCESGGVAVIVPMAVSSDFDGNARYPYTGYPFNPAYPPAATDIGADEFGGIPVDLTPPFISYVPFANIATTGDRTLTATITDVHGVPVSGSGLPRLCWKRNTSGTWSYITGTSLGSNKFTFTFGNGSALGDTVFYFLVAQDSWTLPNVGATPLAGSGGYTANPPTASVIPSTPDRYVIVQSICGTFNVGTGGNYTTLTAAISDINAKGITCPVTLVLTDNNYPAESYPITLNPNGGSSAANTVTIRPATGVNPVFAGVSAGSGILKVNGFDYLVIDGSPAGGSGKNLTFYNASETNGAYAVGFFNNNRIKPASNITIKNCIIRGKPSTTVTNYGVMANADGGGYENIIIDSDSIYGANTGIQFSGEFGGICHNNQITGNVIGSPAELKYITNKGIILQYCDNTLISGNNIMGPAVGNNLPLVRGISIYAGSTGTKIHGNLIHDFYRNADDGSGAAGIWYEAESSSVTEIFNNSIYGIKSSGAAPGASPNNCYGIYIKTGGNIRIIHNSIYLYGDVLSPTGVHDASSACIGILQNGSLTNNLEIRNNIFQNSQQGLFGTCPRDGRAFGIMTAAPDAGNFSVIDHNDYYIDGCNGNVGFIDFNDYANLSDWQAVTGQEVHSLGVNPVFSSQSNLVPTATGMPKAGSYIMAVPVDITGALRTNPPDMGAYEFSYGMSAQTLAATNVSFTAATLHGMAGPAGQNCNVFFDYGQTSAYGSAVAATPSLVSGNSPTPVSTVISNLTAGTWHFRVRMVSFGNITVYGNDMTFSTMPDSILVTGTAGNGSNDCYSASAVITVAGNGSTFIVQNGGSATFVAGQKIRFMPGTKVLAGGYMHGYITTNGEYCNILDQAMVSNPDEVESLPKSVIVQPGDLTVRIYPNPVTSSFTLDLSNPGQNAVVRMDIFTMSGVKVTSETLTGNGSHRISVDRLPVGLYFVRISDGTRVETVKLVKM